MKTLKKLFIICLALVAIFSCVSLVKVAAVDGDITSQQIDKILSNCSSAKNTLNQLHASDALLRVTMGQTYESMSTKLMTRFNDRVSKNDLNNSSLVSITNNFNNALDNFRADYITYEEHLSSVISMDCSKQPVSFYDAVSQARTERNRVHTDIIKLNQYVGQYQQAIVQLRSDYENINSGTVN